MATLLRSVPHHECAKSELLYDDPQFFQTDILEDYTSYVSTKNSVLDSNNPLVFDIENSVDFVDLSDTELKLTFQIHKANGDALATTDKMCPINNTLSSLFQSAQVSLKDQIVSHSNSMYNYRSYIETLLSYGAAAKSGFLECSGWISDEAGKFDQEANSALDKRMKPFVNKKDVEMKSRLHIDLSFQEKILPSNLDIRIVLTPAKPEFIFFSKTENAQFKLKITGATLYVRKVKLNPAKQLAFEKTISKSPIRIPISYVSMRNLTVPANVATYNNDGLYSGVLPHLVIIGIVDNSNFVGTIDKNPYNFAHHDLTSLLLRKNGKNVPTQALTPNYAEDRYVDCYQTIFDAMGVKYDNFDNGISYYQYKNGNCLYAFNLMPDNCSHNNSPATGSLDLSIRFKTTLATSKSVILYAMYDNNIFIDQHRNIITDISA